jgi:hypothetical protein
MRERASLSTEYCFQSHTYSYLSGPGKMRIVEVRTKHTHTSRYDATYREVEIVKDAQTREQVGRLIGAGQAMPGTILRAKGSYVLVKEEHLPRTRPEFARNKVEEC